MSNILEYIQEFAMFNIIEDATHYRMDLKIDNKLHTLNYVFRGEDPNSFDEVRLSFIQYLQDLADDGKNIEKPYNNGGLMFANIEQLRQKYPTSAKVPVMDKHTPGPWHWDNDDLFHGDDKVLDFGCGCCTDKDPTDADKSLIAAAPDLLEALELMVDTYDDGGWPSSTLVIARAAIAKAKGEV